MNLKTEEIKEINKNADEFFGGDTRQAIAAHLFGIFVVKRCGGIPAHADLDKIAEIENQIAAASPVETQEPAATASAVLEILQETFTKLELIEIVEQASRNNREIGHQVALAMYGENALVNGEINELADKSKIGIVKGQITRLLSILSDLEGESSPMSEEPAQDTESTEPAANSESTAPPKDSIATESTSSTEPAQTETV
jgi:BMFP domain-containing protein YqiC